MKVNERESLDGALDDSHPRSVANSPNRNIRPGGFLPAKMITNSSVETECFRKRQTANPWANHPEPA